MKSLSVLLLMLCFGTIQAQSSFNYDKAWKEIENLNKQQGQVKSLLPKVETIYQQAKKDDNWQQRIKAFIYKEGIQSRITDDKDYELEIIQAFKGEIDQAKGAPKAILRSMLAETYLDYYNLNRRKIDERTAVESLDEDFRYWSKHKFKEEVQKLYKASVEEESVLKKEPISDWDFLLEREEETDYLRPTLYDFIAYRYIDFLKDGQVDLSSQEQQNLLDTIWNNLIQFHKKQGNDAALAYNKLHLLKLYKTERPKEYETDLRQLITNFSNNQYTPNLLFEGAKLYIEKFENAPHGAYTDKKKYADKILFYSNEILSRYPKSDLTKAAQNNVKRLTTPYFTLKTEVYNSPEKNIPVGITYRNLEKLHFRVFRFSEEEKNFIDKLNYGRDSEKQKNLARLFNTFQEVDHFELPLEAFDDYQSRTTTGKISGFSAGYYVVVASNDSHFNYGNKDTKIQTQVLYFTPYKLTTQGSHILLTDRETGKPVRHKKIYVYSTEKTSVLLKTLTTDNRGRADYDSDRYFLNYRVEGDPVLLGDRNMHSERELNTEVRKTLQFFTDRKIYRPGQNVFYKIVAYETPPKGARRVSESKDLQITLNDVNGKKVAEQNLTTNEFGSVSGEFVLPNSGLNGQYSLRVVNGDWESSLYYFKVEDYKRPRFKVELTAKDAVYKLDQEVSIDGKAISYSGASLNSTQVTYRVIRQPVFSLLPWWQRYIIPNRIEGQQIAAGETTTDESGNFTINFKAIPGEFPEIGGIYPRKASKDRSFRYDIIAEVTDINGETQTDTETVNVGDREYVIKFPIQDKVDLTTLDSIPFQLQNLNGKPVSAKGGLVLTKLKAPDRVLRHSELGATDYELFEKRDFVKYFPNQPYANENKIENWQDGNTVLDERFDAVGEDYINVDSKNWEPGYYRLKGFIVNKGDTITQEKLIYLYNPKNRFPVDNELFSAELNKTVLQAGEKGKVYFSSAAENAQVFVQVEANQEIVEERWIHLDRESKTFEFPIKEDYRGKIYVYYYFGKYNTAYRKELAADVNTEREKLTIKTKVFRDKLKPGDSETWEFTISGKDKDKVWAEVLATMYDASLDKFEANSLQFNLIDYHRYARYGSWDDNFMSVSGFRWLKGGGLGFDSFSYLQFTSLNWFDFKTWFSGLFRPKYRYLGGRIQTMSKQVTAGNPPSAMPDKIEIADDATEEDELMSIELADLEAEDVDAYANDSDTEKIDLNTVSARKNLQETAFFYPELRTDKEGNVVLKFTIPESLTEWKFMANAYTTDLKTGYLEKNVVTQKELMVTPNPPRFLREGDSITLSAKVDNMTSKEMKGKVRLSLFDPIKGDTLDVEFGNADAEKDFEIAKNSSANLSWRVYVPKDYSAVSYRFVAATADFSDGEESVLPILTNRKLVTETLPIHIREGEERDFVLKNLQENTSKTREDLRLTLEITANPIWQAIFSLPYLRTPEYDNSISNFGQLYGNLISRKILTDNPKIEAVFKDWRDKGELKSKLEQNQDLKEILLAETPWVREAESESEKMKRLAFLFDSNKITTELQATFNRLLDKQLDNGGFPWFDGGEANRYVTNYLLFNFGHLEDLGVEINTLFDGQVKIMVDKMIAYVDQEALTALEQTEKEKKKDFHKTSFFRSYLWARGNYLNRKPLPEKLIAYKDKALDELAKDKFDLSIHTQAESVFVLENYGRHQEAVALLKSLKDRAVISKEMGMYWRDNQPGWFWQEAPIATHSLLTLAFDKILKDEETVENLKVWLLKNRQTNQWNSIKSTTEAVNVLMSTGKNWTNVDESGLDLKVGNQTIDLNDSETQSGSGYLKKTWEKSEIAPEMAEVEVKKTDPGVAWGALYWQYFEDLDQIESADSKIVMRKQLYLKENTENGVRLKEITDKTPIKVGDLVTVRLELQTDRDMQFVHLKDMRVSGFEPVNVLSQYKYKHGLGYYESTRDAATHFFFDTMPKGTYVFEYDLRANNSGEFSNGITTLQNAYAPELSSHSKGIRIRIK